MTEVAWLTSSYPWAEEPVGGIFLRAQALALVRAGQRVSVVAPVPAAPWPLPRLNPRWRAHARAPRLQQDGAVLVARPRYPNVPGQPSWAAPDRFIAGAAWRDRRHWSGAALVHGHYSIIGLAARNLARRAGLPFVLTFHGSDINTWPSLHPERLPDLRAAVREAAAVFTVSRALADRVRDLTAVDATCLPIGSDHREIAAAKLPRDEARRRLGIADDRFVVLFVGRLVPEKGVPAFVSAVLDLGDPYTGILVGAGPSAGLGTDDLRAGHRLVFAGQRSHDEVIQIMSAADALVLPSAAEGLPTVLVEAGSVGLPVVASAVGGIPELLADGRGMLLPDPSAAAIAAALGAIAANPVDARAAAERLREHVLNEHDIDLNATRLAQRYDEIAAAARGPGRPA